MADQSDYPTHTHDEQAAPLELPATTTPTERANQGDHGTTLTLAQAAARSGLSVTTWRRRIKAGKVQGAYLAPSPMGDEWRIPVATVEAVTNQGASGGAHRGGEPTDIAELRDRIAKLEQELAVQRALADERRQTLDQLHTTMRLQITAGDVAPTEPVATPGRKWWGGRK